MTPTEKTLTPYERFEAALVGMDARHVASAGKLRSTNMGGFEVSFWMLPNGRPVLLQRLRDGGCELYFLAQLNSVRIDDLEQALRTYAGV